MPSRSRSSASSKLDPILGLLRMGAEGIIWILLIGACFTYGWVTPVGAHVGSILMLLLGGYVALLWMTGNWSQSTLPGGQGWLLLGAVSILYVLFQVAPAPWPYNVDFSRAASQPDLAVAFESLEISPDSLIVSVDPYPARVAAVKYIAWISFFLASLAIVRHRGAAMRIFFGLAVFGFFQGILGLFSIASTEDFIPAKGTLYNRSHYGAMMAMLLPIMFASLRVARESGGLFSRSIRRGENPILIAYIALVGAMGGLLASASRGGVLLGGGMLIGYLLHQRAIDQGDTSLIRFPKLERKEKGALGTTAREKIWRAVQMGAIVLAIAGSTIFIFQQRGGISVLKLESRLEYWKTGAQIFAEHPFFGIGPGSTRRLLNTYTSELTDSEIIHLHNDWIQFPLEAGLVGTLLIIGVALFPMMAARSSWANLEMSEVGPTSMARRAAAWGAASCLLTALFDFHLRIPLIGMIFALLCAFVITFGWRKARNAGVKTA